MNKNKIEIISRRKVLKLSATFFLITFLLGSCKKEDSNIGDSFQDESLNVTTIDTFTLLTYSDELDSMESDETSVNMLGYYVDPVFGIVDCGIATQLRLSSPVTSFGVANADLVVDSVVLSLKYTDIKYYANLEDMTVEVYELSNELIRTDQTYYTFDTPSNLGVNLVETGYGTVSPDVIALQYLGNGDTLDAHLRVRLDPAIGQNWIIGHNDGLWSDVDDFITYFKGLYIKVDGSGLSSNQGGVLYLSLESALSNVTVYYQDVNVNSPKEFEFSINSSAARYNYINFDRTGTTVDDLLNNPDKGKEEFYMQGSAIRAIVEIPYLLDFNYDSLGNYDPKIINFATLILPIQDFTLAPYDPPTLLFIARIVDKQTSDFTIDYDFGTTLLGSTVSFDESNKEFRFTMTREIQAILNGDIANKGFRIYPPNFFASTVERIIFNGSNSSLKNKPRLEITYTEY